GLFALGAVSGIDGAGWDGLTHGRPEQIVDQLIAIGAVWGYSFVMTMIILKVLDMTMGLRVKEDEEVLGLDVSQHGERAYVIEEVGTLPAPEQTATAARTAAPARAEQPPVAGLRKGAS
ncbi:MAG: hypothetical protein U1B78_02265, partial [Dehalococcoidia bacterium]|nr:hypothetical protein [Dehalococcoidia bacterium]